MTAYHLGQGPRGYLLLVKVMGASKRIGSLKANYSFRLSGIIRRGSTGGIEEAGLSGQRKLVIVVHSTRTQYIQPSSSIYLYRSGDDATNDDTTLNELSKFEGTMKLQGLLNLEAFTTALGESAVCRPTRKST